MSRRTGNNYSGPRWAFATETPSRPSAPGESHIRSGSSQNIYEGDRVEITDVGVRKAEGYRRAGDRGIVNSKSYGSGNGWVFEVLWDEWFPVEGPYREIDLRKVRS